MKVKIFLLALAVSAVASASVVTADVEKLPLADRAFAPILSPDGSQLLFSSQDHSGLKLLDLSSMELTVLDEENGAGFSPIFSSDGTKVYYRTAIVLDGLLNRDVKQFDLLTGTKSQLLAPMRKMTDLHSFDSATYASAAYDHIDVTIKGITTAITPLPDAHSYLWVSLSPAGDKLLFSEPFTGVYVCNLDGSNTQKLVERGDFPCWLSNNIVATVVTTDDGSDVIASRVVAIDLASGATTDLTPADPDNIVTEISAAPEAAKLALSTTMGDIFIMNLTISK